MARIAWFSELNIDQPSSSHAAYASDQLLPFLRTEFEIDLYHNSFEAYQDYPTYHYLTASERHQSTPYDIFFYQLEDRFESNFVRQFAGVMPGVIWFHDFLFTTHGPEPILNSPWEEVIKKYNDAMHPWPERGYEFPERERSGVREAGLSFINLFSSEIAHSEYKRKNSGELLRSSAYLPLPAGTPKTKAISDKPRLCFCGSPRIEHRGHKILQAISELDLKVQIKWLLDEKELEQAKELCKEFSLQDVECISGRTPKKWAELIRPGDIALHSLFSVYGQTGPYLGISMRLGLPTIVSDFAVADFMPDAFVAKIQPGETEVTELKETLSKLCSGEVLPSSEAVSKFAADSFDSKLIAEELSYLLKSSHDDLREMRERWEALEQDARSELIAFLTNERKLDDDLFGKNSSAVPVSVFQELGWK